MAKFRRLLGQTNSVRNRPNRYNLSQSTYKYNVPTYITNTNTNLGPTYTPIQSLPTPQPTTAPVLDYTIKHSYTIPENPVQVIPGITPYNPPRPLYSSRQLPNTRPQTGYISNILNPSRQTPCSINQIFRDVLNAKRNILNKLVTKNTRRPALYPSHPTQHIVPYPVSFQPPPFNYNRIPAMHDSSYTYGKYCIFLYLSRQWLVSFINNLSVYFLLLTLTLSIEVVTTYSCDAINIKDLYSIHMGHSQ